ncbi:MAG TPA: response regulator [Bdellovibrionales bacterium]|mgnify:CR=1 FL=1|nr:response regulator [Bdellovibrionales bacterium]
MRNAVKVLVVDDDKNAGQALSEIVKRLGFKPVRANTPSEALNIARLQTLHAAVIDVMLPKMSGVDVAAEMRNSKFGDSPVVLISGVFKDKSFAAEAMRKTDAVDFLFKPYTVEEITATLKVALAPLLSAEKWSVQSLLTRKVSSPRARARAIEHLDQIKGLDFPYVLSYLLESKVSGNLNIVNNLGEIFGVTLNKGSLADVDSSESRATCILALISNGFLAQEDWEEYQSYGNKKFALEGLVQDGYVSPHAVAVAKHEQILHDFKAICAAPALQLNFVPAEESEELPKHAVRMGELLTVFLFNLAEFFPVEYLADFYAPVLSYPLHLQQTGDDLQSLWKLEMFRGIAGIGEVIERNGTMEELLARFPKAHERVYQCIHLLVLNGWVIFNDLNRAKAMHNMLDRFKKLHSELSTRAPDQVFAYFGAPPNAQRKVLDGILEEFLRSNDPDQISKESHKDLHELCKSLCDIMRDAHDIMTDEVKRAKLFEQQKVTETENVKISNKLTAEGLDLLRKGQFPQALAKIKEAGTKHTTALQYLIQVWAEMKTGAGSNKMRTQEILRALDQMHPEDRKTPYYFMAMGLVKRSLGDAQANSYFERALLLDPQFVEARRELNVAPSAPKKSEKLDIFSGDITAVVSQLFRRKSD